MSDLSRDEYAAVLNGLKEKIQSARIRTALNVNTELLVLYWEIGNTINKQENIEGWGAKTVERLSLDLKIEFSDMKGLSARNLRYMRDFARAYPEFPILQHPAAKLQSTDFQEGAGISTEQVILLQHAARLPWGHHQVILDKVKSREHRCFYITKAVAEQWGRKVLAIQIDSGLYERNGKSITNFSNTLPEIDSDLAKETFKNPYVFDFITLGTEAKEKDLERALSSI